MISYKFFKELTDQEIKKVEEIFFETSAIKEFTSDQAKSNFKYKYLEYYQTHHPENFISILHDNILLGYICGVDNSQEAIELYKLLPHYATFEEYFDQYPAHLHINLSLASTGLGIGSKLITFFEKYLASKSIKGVHLITSPSSRNVHFYQKNQYNFAVEKCFEDAALLFLGKSLTH